MIPMYADEEFDGVLPKEPYPPCLRMADRALLAGYPPVDEEFPSIVLYTFVIPIPDIYIYMALVLYVRWIS